MARPKNKKSEPEPPEGDDIERKPGVGGLFYKLALAGVGGVMLAPETIVGLLRRQDDEKESVEGDAEADSDATEEGAPKPDWVDATIDRVLRTFNVPSRAEVEEVTERIERLTEQVQRLRERKGRA